MSPISLVLNLIWIVFGGGLMAFAWLIVAVVMAITIIGLPWSRAAFEIAGYTLFPFGREAVDRRLVTGRDDIGTGGLGFIGNVLWFIFAGWWLAIGHILSGIACALTIIGLPLAIAHFKLVRISLAPIGLTVVSTGR
ncbi:MAG TPA: YccF domain-containing protein [Magnetospirillaceae bacterium]|nr:YccF domain-containing protein [Magnetospirillaceae bacterium]